MPNAECRINDEARITNGTLRCDFVIRHLSIPSSFVIRISSLRPPRSRTDRTNPGALCSCRQSADVASSGRIFVRRFRYRSARFFRLLNRQITQNKKFLQFFLGDLFCDIGIRIQNHAGFQGVADQFFLACLLDRLPDDAAQSQKLLNLIDCFAASILWLRKFLQMN